LLMNDDDACALCTPPKSVIIRSKQVLAFHSLSPVAPGHVIVATTAHEVRFSDLTTEAAQELFSLAWRLAAVLERMTGTQRVYMLRIGDDVEHIHVHILPRRVNETAGKEIFSALRSNAPIVEQAEIDDLVERLRSSLVAWGT
jgi:diadenosine tetraphosphate (Ap4A) HIT family hydrolase